MTIEPVRICGGDSGESLANGAEEFGIGPGLCLAQVSFDLGPHHLDGIEIGAVGWQEKQPGPVGFNQLLRFKVTMGREVVAHYDVAWPQGGAKHLPDILPKDIGVGRPLDDQATGHPVEPDGAEHGHGVPAPAGGVIVEATAAAHPAIEPRQVGLGRGLVDKNQSPGIAALLKLPPEPPLLDDVNAILFAGPQRFFLAGSRAAAGCCGWLPSCR